MFCTCFVLYKTYGYLVDNQQSKLSKLSQLYKDRYILIGFNYKISFLLILIRFTKKICRIFVHQGVLKVRGGEVRAVDQYQKHSTLWPVVPTLAMFYQPGWKVQAVFPVFRWHRSEGHGKTSACRFCVGVPGQKDMDENNWGRAMIIQYNQISWLTRQPRSETVDPASV